MPLAPNLQTAFTRVGTEFKAIRTLISGSGTGNISGLATTDKSSLVAAINEARTTGGATNLDSLTDVQVTTPAAGHIIRYDGTANQFVNVDGATFFQPLDSDLTAIAALATTSFGRGLLTMADSAALTAQIQQASETIVGRTRYATNAETATGTSTALAVHPAGLASRLSSYQPLDSDLTAIAALTTTTFGRGLLALADSAALTAQVRAGSESVTGVVQFATAAQTSTGTSTALAVHPAGLKPLLDAKANTAGLGYFAYGTDAANLTGTLPTAVLPPLAVNDTFVVASQTEMLALTAQRGDMAIRTDNGRTYVLAAEGASTLANWKEITAAGAVTSVAGKTGTVVLVKADVGLANVDNTSDSDKVASGPIASALAGKQPLDSELTALAGLTSAADTLPYFSGSGTAALATFTAFGRTLVASADAAAARSNLSVYSTTQIGDPETDFTAGFVSALT